MFDSRVVVEEDGDFWRIFRRLGYDGARDHWDIEVGFRTDFASIPWFVRWLLSPTGKHNRAAVLHDLLARIAAGIIASCRECQHGKPGHDCDLPKYVNRLDADRIFLRVLRELEVPEWRAQAMYRGVRIAHHLHL